MSAPRKRKKFFSTTPEKLPKFSATKIVDISLENHAEEILSRAQEARKFFQKPLRKNLIKFRNELEYSRANGEDPLLLFPEEIWEMILGLVEDVNDLANCAKTCTLFQSVINSSNQELLFGKVFPFVFSYLNPEENSYTPVETLVKCGRVCKKWRAGVNSFSNNYFRAEKFISGNLNALKMEPTKYFRNKTLLELWEEDLPRSQEEIMERQIEDGVHNVEIENSSDSDSDEDENLPPGFLQLERNIRNANRKWKIGNVPFLTEKTFYLNAMPTSSQLASLKVYGPLLWRATFKFSNTDDFQQIHNLFENVLNACPNLVKVKFSGEFDVCKVPGMKNKKIPTTLQLNIPTHLKLESFELDTDEFGGRQFPADIQFHLIKDLNLKLEHVKVSQWDDKMASLEWKSLTSLQILAYKSSQVLQSLEKTSAPNLHKLSIRLECNLLDLTQLFRSINRFPNLRSLNIFLIGRLDTDFEKKVNVPLELLTINRIKTLEIASRQLVASQLIPVLFPMVRNLAVRFGDELGYPSSSAKLYLDKDPYLPNKSHYIQFYNGSLMYKSNIWSMLPHLEFLKLVHNVEDCHVRNFIYEEMFDIQEFTRQGYLFETDKFLQAQHLHMQQVWTEAERQLKEKFRLQVSKVEETTKKQKSSTRTSPRMICQKQVDAQICKQIFPIIIPKMTLQEALDCRLVCKTWWMSIRRVEFPVYQFDFPLDTKVKEQKFAYKLKESVSAPYFGRNIVVSLRKPNPITNDIIRMLQENGEYITKLTIATEDNVVPEVVDIYQICFEVMKNCPELRKFSLQIPAISNYSHNAYETLTLSKKLICPKNLVSLAICGPDLQWLSVLDMICHDVGSMCHLQLQSLQQTDFSKSLARCGSRLEKLENLVFTHFNGRSLGKPDRNAQNLKSLCLCVTGGNMTVESFGKLAKYYPKLQVLELQFPPTFVGLNHNLMYTNSEHVLGVHMAKIMLKDKYQVSLDFLVHLPFIRTLWIIYGRAVTVLSEENCEPINKKQRPPDTSEYDNGIDLVPPRKPERDFIQLVKYLKDKKLQSHDIKNIYGSNIWTVLRKLHTLEVVYCPKVNVFERTVFKRK